MLNYMGIKSKMLVSFSVVMILSLSFLSYFSILQYEKRLQNDNINYANRVIGNLVNTLDDYIIEIENLTNLVNYNHNIQNYLISHKRDIVLEDISRETIIDKRSQNFQMSMELLGNIITTRNDIASIFIYNDDNLMLYKSTALHFNTPFIYTEQPWYLDITDAQKKPFITGPYLQPESGRSGEAYFSMNKLIESYDGYDDLGIIVVNANLNTIRNFGNSFSLDHDGFIFITSPSGVMVYHPENDYIKNIQDPETIMEIYEDVMPRVNKAKGGSFLANINDEKHQIVHTSLNGADWSIIAVTSYKNMLGGAYSLRRAILLVGLLSILIILAIMYYISTKITRPILVLKQYMDKADQGNFDAKVDINTRDEIGMLGNSFNHMLDRIKTLMAQVVSEQEEKRKQEFNALQAQINPHFLYNTLDSIIWMVEGNNKDVIPMTEALSKLFRISLSKGQTLIPLKDELEHVRNYLIIQSMRYTNKFNYTISADNSLYDCRTLKLILQPLVENAIYHGIKNKATKGSIDIHAYQQDNALVIVVSDDGIGMDNDKCNSILDAYLENTQSTDINSGSNIGVKNVNERLQLYFGKEYGLHYESTPGVGTKCFVRLPIIKD